ncbi:uncharacterized protein LOC117784081 [Drosophila innubila]|uniref:uncharacterized protein LOC117784081 n=1 Tax=Drosophila innubila TaxID=198719 RepID=UPI00148E7281|nr:uncharacterized protein LOC117784081 [Drosophila innubila]
MDNQILGTKFELPKSPASTLNGEYYNDDDSDSEVEFVGTYRPQANTINYANSQQIFEHANLNGNCYIPHITSNVGQANLNDTGYIPHITSNVGQMPLLLATPPQSPHETQTQTQDLDMPSLRTLLSYNYAPTGYIMHIPCFLCKQPFNNIDSLRNHLGMHAAQINRNSGVTPVPPPPHFRPYMEPININGTYPAPVSVSVPVPQLPTYVPPIINMNSTYPAPVPVPAPDPVSVPQFPVYVPPIINMNSTYPDPVRAPAPLNAPVPAPGATSTIQDHKVSTESTKFTCELCGKVLRTEVCRIIHQRMHNMSPELRKKCTTKVFRCPYCKRSYRLEYNLMKHMLVRHGPHPTPPTVAATPTSQPELPTQPTPPSSADGEINTPINKVWSSKFQKPLPSLADGDIKKPTSKRKVWSTKLLNAVAAANYNPANEAASKYKSPTEEVHQSSVNPLMLSKPKQKYALRSPFCNPNLWVDYDNHIP